MSACILICHIDVHLCYIITHHCYCLDFYPWFCCLVHSPKPVVLCRLFYYYYCYYYHCWLKLIYIYIFCSFIGICDISNCSMFGIKWTGIVWWYHCTHEGVHMMFKACERGTWLWGLCLFGCAISDLLIWYRFNYRGSGITSLKLYSASDTCLD